MSAAADGNLDILRAFRRSPDGTWECLRDVDILSPGGGTVAVRAGAVFHYGERTAGLDVAEYLEALGAQFGS